MEFSMEKTKKLSHREKISPQPLGEGIVSPGGGLNCSQVILTAFGPGLGLPKDLSLKVAAPFGGGIGCMQGTCGAISAAYMILGLRYGREDGDAPGPMEETYNRVREFTRRFRTIHGSTTCRDLLACDITTEKGLDQAKKEERFSRLCSRYVKSAADILRDML